MKESKAKILSGVYKEYHTAKFIDNNTLEIFYKDGSKAIRYHHTDIITWHPNGDITLNSNGWETPSTKKRMNKYSPFYVIQNDFIWYVYKPIQKLCWNPKAPDFCGIKFYDGITFNSKGEVKK